MPEVQSKTKRYLYCDNGARPAELVVTDGPPLLVGMAQPSELLYEPVAKSWLVRLGDEVHGYPKIRVRRLFENRVEAVPPNLSVHRCSTRALQYGTSNPKFRGPPSGFAPTDFYKLRGYGFGRREPEAGRRLEVWDELNWSSFRINGYPVMLIGLGSLMGLEQSTANLPG